MVVVVTGPAGDVLVAGENLVVEQKLPEPCLTRVEGDELGVGQRARQVRRERRSGENETEVKTENAMSDIRRTSVGLLSGLFLAATPALADLEVARDLMEAHRFEEALAELEPAARSGNAEAEELIGVMYALGLGVEQDYVRAFDWYLRAAMKGHAGAQSGVGWYYEVGLGMPAPDLVRAYAWYMLSAIGGDPDAAISQEEVVKKMTPEDIEKAHEIVSDYKPWLYPFR
jgi:hypothetical protein